MKIERYQTMVFDCDGVVLNSNIVKTEAFRQAALPYGSAAAEALVAYHVARGGISRYQKFQYFLDEIVSGAQGRGLENLLDSYAAAARSGLLSCDVAPGLVELRAATPKSNWMIVSGGDQEELLDIFSIRRLIGLFDRGIFGSPDSKEDILTRELETGNLQTPALFLGDSHYDYIAAKAAGLDFVFVSGWSEMTDWERFVADNKIPHIPDIQSLLRYTEGFL